MRKLLKNYALDTGTGKIVGLNSQPELGTELTSEESKKYHISELNMTIYIRPGHTIQEWLVRYARRNEVAKRLFKKYNVTPEIIEEVKGSEKRRVYSRTK